MSLSDVLLSMLREPMSGTDLSGLFRGTIGHFWQADLSQIYRALEALERDGCVKSNSVPSSRGPARRVYRLTTRGRRRLADWIRRPPSIPPAKFEYLAQLFSVTADERPGRHALAILKSMRDEAAGAVGVLEAIDAQMRQTPGYPEALPASLFYPWLTLRHGLMRRRSLLQWIDECLEHLRHRPEAADQDAGPTALPELLQMLRAAANGVGSGQPTKDHE
jgi:DNA-binding PadR family transcriptional regulator